MKFMLDTNAYWEILNLHSIGNDTAIEPLQSGGKYEFLIPEVVCMEIYSVLGKYARGKSPNTEVCTKKIDNGSECGQRWVVNAAVPRLNRREHLLLFNLLKSIEDGTNQEFVLHIIELDKAVLETSRTLLERYTPKQDLRSLDATIAACALEYMKTGNLTVYTKDKALLNILKAVEVPCVNTLG